jgi:asparagine synthase (glutamine-hydrolysing)
MMQALGHRGPDDSAIWRDGSIGFAHTRLSIIDLEGSRQPMALDGHVLAYNGEVFDYRDLRARLGGAFASGGDTEALLRLLARDGIPGLAGIDGQFAFAWFDSHERVLRLVRDPLGVLPLYYAHDGHQIAFASEPKALLAVRPELRAVDPDSLADYLVHRSVPAPYTLFQGIRKVEPGHVVAVSADGRFRDEAYWRVPNREPDETISARDAIARTERALVRSVSNRLVADVPVGAYLSGGLDSSLIVALATAQGHARLNTYSAGFADRRFDELPFARTVSAQLGTTHHEVVVGADEFAALWEELSWYRDAPLSEPADVAVYKLARLARQDVKVVLSGEGSDELFGGYPKYRAVRIACMLERLPLIKPAAERLQRALPRSLSRLRVPLRAVAASSPAERQRAWFSAFSEPELARLTSHRGHRRHVAINDGLRGDAVQQLLYYDCHTWLADNLLERGDRMSMATSVESRPPFMARDVVETAFALPSRFKAGGRTTKWVIKQIARKYLPAQIVDRKKVGFRVPLDRWFRGEIQDFARATLLARNAFVCEVFDRRAVTAIVDDHTSARRDEEMKLWILLSLEMWHRRFIA